MLEGLEQIFERIKAKGHIANEDAKVLREIFGEKFERALELAQAHGVKRYVNATTGRTLYVVIGREGEYEVVPLAPFCECQDFLKWALTGRRYVCYHLLAQRLAEALGTEDVFIISAT